MKRREYLELSSACLHSYLSLVIELGEGSRPFPPRSLVPCKGIGQEGLQSALLGVEG
jgi:hypothetical protein